MALSNADFATIRFPLTPEEAAAQRDEWIGYTVDRSDVVSVARVRVVEPEFQLVPVVGDWAYFATGSRLGLEEHRPGVVVQVVQVKCLKGTASGTFTIRFKPPDPTPAAPMSDAPYEPRRLLEGHEYVFFCRRTAESLQLIDFKDLRDDPELIRDIIAYRERSNVKQPRR